MADDLTDDDLVYIPFANLQPGQLSRAFLIRAEHAIKEQNDHEYFAETRLAAQRRDDDQHKAEERELHEREELLLDHIRAQEERLQEEAVELDKRTIKLDDGRRAYVDGDKYRDAQGRELTGADRAEAEQHHLEQPKAATWQEKADIEEQQRQMALMRHNVEDLRAGKGDLNEGNALTAYEQDLQAKLANQPAVQKAPDYGSADYMATLSGLSASFKQATTATGPEDVFPHAAPAQSSNTLKIAVPGS